MTTERRSIAIANLAVLGATLAAAPARAATQWPTSVVGTWSGVSNITAVQLVIASQATADECPIITGTMTDQPSGTADSIQGFYCPGSGRIDFVRSVGTTATVYQAYTGSLSQIASPQLMAGLMDQERIVSSGAPLGEYNFSFQK